MELRARMEEIQESGFSMTSVQETLSSAMRDTKSILKHVADVTADVTADVKRATTGV